MIKQCFTDGLISIAIVLSLLRTDLSNYLNSDYITYPEVQEIILGTSTAYGRVNYNNNRDLLSNLGRQHVRLKNIDYGRIFSTSLYRELRQLTFASFLERDYYSTYLVSADHVSSSNPGSSSSSHADHTNEDDDDLFQDDTNEDILATALDQAADYVDNSENEEEQEEANNVEYLNLINTSNNLNSTKEAEVEEGTAAVSGISTVFNRELVNSTSNSTTNTGTTSCSNTSSPASSDLTKEDLDLIDVLYRQDIDLGVQREVYDVNLRRELEREQEQVLQKEREKHKQLELHQLKLQEEQHRLKQQWLMENYTRDTETGEWIPLQQTPSPPLQQQQQQPPPLQHCNYGNVSQINVTEQPLQPTTSNNQSELALTSIPLTPNIPNSSLEEALQTLDIESRKNVSEEPALEHYLDNYLASNQIANFSDTSSDQLNSPSFGCNLLPCSSNTTNSCPEDQSMNVNYYQEQPPPPPPPSQQPNVYERQNSLDNWWREIMGSSETSVENPSHSRELIQNATLPVPSGEMGCGNIFNTSLSCNSSSFLNGSSGHSSEWDNQNLLFSNISAAINESNSLMEIEKMLRGNTLVGNLTLPNINLDEGLMDDGSSDSAVCSLAGSASPFQDFNDSHNPSPYDHIEGATGGSDYDSSSSSSSGSANGHKAVKTEPNSSYYCSYGSMGGQQVASMNHSTSSNDTDFNYQPSNTNHIQHNHTYSQQHSQQQHPQPQKSSLSNPKSIRQEMLPGPHKSSKSAAMSHSRGPTSRDQKRLRELNVPMTMSQIIDSSVEEFNELVRKYPLPESHMRLIRDIRRRGKNKVAAQNCRKRKLNVIGTLEEEVLNLRETRNRLLLEGNVIDRKTREMKEKYKVYYQEVFASLRDEFGNPYDPQEYCLQQSSDGNVFLVRKSFTPEEKSLESNRKKKNRR